MSGAGSCTTPSPCYARSARADPAADVHWRADPAADVHWRKVYRMIAALGEIGAPIKAVEGAYFEGRGRAPLRYSLSMSAVVDRMRLRR